MDPACVDAALALADLHTAARRYDQAISVLNAALARHNADYLHSR